MLYPVVLRMKCCYQFSFIISYCPWFTSSYIAWQINAIQSLPFSRYKILVCRHLVRLLGCGISSSQGQYPCRTTQTQKKHRHTSMPRMGFKPSILMCEWYMPIWPLWSAPDSLL
jgi:hypothetical protein